MGETSQFITPRKLQIHRSISEPRNISRPKWIKIVFTIARAEREREREESVVLLLIQLT